MSKALRRRRLPLAARSTARIGLVMLGRFMALVAVRPASMMISLVHAASVLCPDVPRRWRAFCGRRSGRRHPSTLESGDMCQCREGKREGEKRCVFCILKVSFRLEF